MLKRLRERKTLEQIQEEYLVDLISPLYQCYNRLKNEDLNVHPDLKKFLKSVKETADLAYDICDIDHKFW